MSPWEAARRRKAGDKSIPVAKSFHKHGVPDLNTSDRVYCIHRLHTVRELCLSLEPLLTTRELKAYLRSAADRDPRGILPIFIHHSWHEGEPGHPTDAPAEGDFSNMLDELANPYTPNSIFEDTIRLMHIEEQVLQGYLPRSAKEAEVKRLMEVKGMRHATKQEMREDKVCDGAGSVWGRDMDQRIALFKRLEEKHARGEPYEYKPCFLKNNKP